MSKKKEESLGLWKGRIQKAEKFRDQEKNTKGWDRFIREYEGEYGVGRMAENMPIPVINMVYGYVHTMLSKLFMRDPYIAVNAKGYKYIERAKLLEAAINYVIFEIGLKKEIKKLLIDTMLVGHGWLKYGYTGSVGHVSVPEDKKGKKDKDPVEEINEFIKNEEIFCVYVPWNDILFDTMAKDPPYDCRWIAHSFIKPLEAIKKSEIYENTENLKPNVSQKDDSSKKEYTSMFDSDMELVKIWEIWDKDSNRIYAIAENHDEFLRDQENPLEMEGLPFSMLKFNDIPGKPYPISDIALIEPQILERIKLRATQVNHIKRWNRQMAVQKGSMEREEMEKFILGIEGSIIQYDKGFSPPVPIQYAPMQAEIFALDTLLEQDLDAVIGQTSVERGGPARTKTKTLGELNTQIQGTNSRMSRRMDVLEDFLEEVCRKIIQLLKQFQDVPKYVRITGHSPEQIVSDLSSGATRETPFDGTGFIFTKEDIQGEYDIEVKAGSTIPLTRENRLKVLETILKMVSGVGLQPGGPVIKTVIKEILRDLDIKSAEKAFDEEEAISKAQQKSQQLTPSAPGQLGTPPSVQGPRPMALPQ